MNKVILTLAMAGTLCTSAYAQSAYTTNLSVSGAADYESQYVFRGKKIANGSIQPKIELNYQIPAGSMFPNGSLYAGAWSNQPISRRGTAGGPDQANEVDLYGGYRLSLDSWLKGLSADVGDIYYMYPEAGGSSVPNRYGGPIDRTDEAYFGVTMDTRVFFGPDTSGPFASHNLNPAVYYYHDWFLDSNTVEFSMSYRIDLSAFTQGLFATLSAEAGTTDAHEAWGDQVYIAALPGNHSPNWRNGYAYYGVNAVLSYTISPNGSVFIGAHYAGNNDGTGLAPLGAATGETAQTGGRADSIWAGGGFKFSM
jgi:uncharacterized protein (TIGR02001 family)